MKNKYIGLYQKNKVLSYKRVVAECAAALVTLSEMISDISDNDSEVLLAQQQYVDELIATKNLIKKKLGYEGGYDAEKMYQFPHNTQLLVGGEIKGNITSIIQNCVKWVSEFDEAVKRKGHIDVTKYEIGIYLMTYKGLHCA